MRRTTGILVALLAVLAACKAEPPPKSPEEQVRDGLDALLAAVESCDPAAFRAAHTQLGREALKALNGVVDPATFEPTVSAGLDDAGVAWTCRLARAAGFSRANLKVLTMVVNDRAGRAKVRVTVKGEEFAFPFAREKGAWRSPHPGFIFLASEFKSWQDPVLASVPEGPRREALQEQIEKAAKVIRSHQPTWQEFPEFPDVEKKEKMM